MTRAHLRHARGSLNKQAVVPPQILRSEYSSSSRQPTMSDATANTNGVAQLNQKVWFITGTSPAIHSVSPILIIPRRSPR